MEEKNEIVESESAETMSKEDVMEQRKGSVLKNTLILIVGTVLPRMINLLTTPIIAGTISTEQYGIIDGITVIILNLVVPVGCFQLEQAFFRFIIDAKDDKDRKRVITSGYTLIGVLMLIIGTIALFVPINALFNDYTKPWRYLLIIYIWIEIITQMSKYVLRGFSKLKDYSTFAAMAVMINFIATFITMKIFHMGYEGVLLSLTLADVISIFFILAKSHMFQYFDRHYIEIDVMKEMLKYSIPFIPNMISWYINQVSDRTIILMFLNASANGLYSMANKIPSIVNILYPAFNMAWMESATRTVNEEGTEEYYQDMFKMLFKVLTGGLAGLMAVSPWIFFIIRGQASFNEAYLYTPILIIATYFYCYAQFFASIYIAVKAATNMSITSAVAAGINLVINLLFIKQIGVYAAVLSTLAANLVLAGYRYINLNRHYYKLRVSKRIVALSIIIIGIEYCITLKGFNLAVFETNNFGYIMFGINFVIGCAYAWFLCGDIALGMLGKILKKFKKA